MGISTKEKDELGKTLKDLNLSNEEVNRFEKAFKDPEFLKLFEDYAKEVSDPKVKEETDLYLRQLEAEGRAEEVYGKGVQLVVPDEAFVLKTKNKSTGEKVFINVCKSDKVEKCKSTVGVDASGKKGTHFEIPLSLSQQKQGTDKTGKAFTVWDFVVHPETVTLALANPAIKSMLAETAMEKIEQVHKIKLQRQFKVPKATYKATESCPKPHVLAIRTGDGGQSMSGRLKPATSTTPAGVSADTKQQDVSSKTPAARSAFSFDATKKYGEPQEHSQPGYKHASGEVTPKWEVIHRGQMDLATAWGDAGRNLLVDVTHPQELSVRVQLPGVTSAAAVELDVSRESFSLVVSDRYKLDAKLPYPVNDALGKAKFDKAKAQLEVTLPVLPPPLPPKAALRQLVQETSSAPDETTEGGSVTSAHAATAEESPEAAKEAAKEAALEAVHEPSAAASTTAEADVQSDTSITYPCSAATDPVASSNSPNDADEMTENQRRWLQLHTQQQGTIPEAAHASVSVTDAPCSIAPGVLDSDSFIPSATFTGSKPGWVFTTGPQGLGYYKDTRSLKEVQKNKPSTPEPQESSTNAAQKALQALTNAGIASLPCAMPPAHSFSSQAAGVMLKPRLNRSFAEDLD